MEHLSLEKLNMCSEAAVGNLLEVTLNTRSRPFWSLFSSRLQVQLSIRTFASSGLIYYVAHQNQMDYAVLQLHGGRLHFMFDLGKGRTKVSHPALLSDGKWHTVSSWEALSPVPYFLGPPLALIPLS